MRTFDRLPSLDQGQFTRYQYLEKAIHNVEKEIPIPDYFISFYDQGSDGACVGFASSMMMSVVNDYKLYLPKKLWQMAKLFDEIDDTQFGDDGGTTVDGSMRVLKKIGHMKADTSSWSIDDGILAYKWAKSVDAIRLAISRETPVQLGINWYENFNNPMLKENEYWIGLGYLGKIVGGHSVLCVGASDRRNAIAIQNTWGESYPKVWMPYKILEKLISEYGEAVLITDRTTNYDFKEFAVKVTHKRGLNVRDAPSTCGNILGALPFSLKSNYKVVNSIINADNQTWYQIIFKEETGFIHSQYTKIV